MTLHPRGPEHDPLYGDTPIGDLRMVVQAKALVSARRHLFREHGFTRAQLRQRSGWQVLAWHLDAHGIPDAGFPDTAMPWGLESVVHRLAGVSSPPIDGEPDGSR
jgi:hypothetical protein